MNEGLVHVHWEQDNAVRDALEHLLETAHAAARDPRRIGRVDEVIRAGLQALGDELISTVLAGRMVEVFESGEWAPCECGGARRPTPLTPSRIRTGLTGHEIVIRSPRLRCEDCGEVAFGLERAMALDENGCTRLLRELAVLGAVAGPLDHGAKATLASLAGIDVTQRTLRLLCEQAGTQAWVLMAEGLLGRVAALPPHARLLIALERGPCGGGGDRHDVVLGTLFTEAALDSSVASPPRPLERLLVATRGGPEELGGLLLNAAARLLPRTERGGLAFDRVVVVGDESSWIDELIADALPGAGRVLQPRLLAGALAKASRVYRGAAEQHFWYGRQLARLLGGQLPEVMAELRSCMRCGASTPEHDALSNLCGFLDERRHLLRYAEAGVDRTFSRHSAALNALSQATPTAVKFPGANGDTRGSDAMLALHCALHSTSGLECLFESMDGAAWGEPGNAAATGD